jgi:hypothetical protein
MGMLARGNGLRCDQGTRPLVPRLESFDPTPLV